MLLPEPFCREHENAILLDSEGCQHVPRVSTPSLGTSSSEDSESWSKRFFSFEQNSKEITFCLSEWTSSSDCYCALLRERSFLSKDLLISQEPIILNLFLFVSKIKFIIAKFCFVEVKRKYFHLQQTLKLKSDYLISIN